MFQIMVTPILAKIVVAASLMSAVTLLEAAGQLAAGDLPTVKPTGEPLANEDSLPEKPKENGGKLAEEKKQVTDHIRDPFRTTDLMREAAERASGIPSVGGVPANLIPTKIPSLKLRGFSEDGIQPAVALLEVQGAGVFVVRKHDSLTVPADDHHVGLFVHDVTQHGIVMEVQGSGRMILVR
jgi:hypothetical protein